MLSLQNGDTEVWFCPTSVTAPSLISDDERTRAQNMEPASKAQEFLAARGWLRWLCSRYLPQKSAATLRFKIGENGKPYSVDFPQLHFNLSHSGTFVAIAFSARPIGIDLELVRPVPDWPLLAQDLLPDTTIARLQALSPELQEAAFLSAFTALEACTKASGFGLARPAVFISPGERPVSTRLKATWRQRREEVPVHGLAMKIHSYGSAVPLECPEGYVGHVCVLPA